MPVWYRCRRKSCDQPFMSPGERDTHEAAASHRPEDLAQSRQQLGLPRHTDPSYHAYQAGWCICGAEDPSLARKIRIADILPPQGHTTGKPSLDTVEGNWQEHRG